MPPQCGAFANGVTDWPAAPHATFLPTLVPAAYRMHVRSATSASGIALSQVDEMR